MPLESANIHFEGKYDKGKKLKCMCKQQPRDTFFTNGCLKAAQLDDGDWLLACMHAVCRTKSGGHVCQGQYPF